MAGVANEFVLDPGALDAILKSDTGMVADYIARKTEEVAAAARGTAPTRTGALNSSIETRMESRAEGPTGVVVANIEYADFVVRGTRAHVITPSAAKVLRFPAGGGTLIYRPAVEHPGTAANDFLGRALGQVFP